ncbi:MAG: 3'-5' exonuclease [Nocardioides sp.]|jgi:DNA polymerase-3 subunit epsilon
MRLWRRVSTWSAPLEGPWRDARFTVIDVETTGLDLDSDEIVSIGAVDVVQGRVDNATSWYQPVRPSCPIATEALKIHSLTRDELASAPTMPQVIDALHARLHGSVLVAHAAWIERAFLNRALAPLRQRVPEGLVDTAALARACGRGVEVEGHEPSLELLARQLDLPVFTPHHALGDALTTAVLFIVLMGHLERDREPLQVADVVRLSRKHAQG